MRRDTANQDASNGAKDLILARMTLCALVCAPFGFYTGWIHLPSGVPSSVVVLSGVWGAGLAMLLGAITGLVAGCGASLVRWAVWRPQGRTLAAGVETFVFTLVLCWLLLNEALSILTYQVFGWDTFLYLFYNPVEVLEASWEIAGRYIVLVFGGSAVLAVMLFFPLRRAHLRDGGWGRGFWNGRVIRGGVGAVVGVTFLTLVVQFLGQPGVALATLSRSAPALRALKLPRALLGDELAREDVTPTWGERLASDDAYAARMGSADPPLNVVLMILESVSARALGCYGRQRDVTPNLDALAEKGVLFEHCVAGASFSSYSLVSIVNSLYMLRAERNDHFRNADFPHFGVQRMLRLAGFQTALFSSGNESFENIRLFYPPGGFDHYFSHDTCDIPKWDSMRMDDHHTAEAFETWLEARKDERPLFCMFNLQSTHFNYEVPEPWASHYQPVPQGYSSGSAIIYMPPDLVPQMRNAYDNALRCLDHNVGRICRALESKGMLENTVMVITADHGEAFMEHGLARHGVHSYEEMVHVPMIVLAPARVQPQRISHTVSHLDIAPTIAGLLGLQPHPSWQGQDVLSGHYDSSGRAVFTVLQLTRWQEAVYLDGIKYIYDLSVCKDWLFDLRIDPKETLNLAESNAALRGRMQDVLGRWHSRQLAYYDRENRPFRRYIGRMGRITTSVASPK